MKLVYCEKTRTIRQLPQNYLIAQYTTHWICDPDLAANISLCVKVFKATQSSYFAKWGSPSMLIANLHITPIKKIKKVERSVTFPLENMVKIRHVYKNISLKGMGHAMKYNEENVKYLSKITRENVKLIGDRLNIKWEVIVAVRIKRKDHPPDAWSIIIIGTDEFKQVRHFWRKETVSSQAGQTLLYTESKRPKMVNKIISKFGEEYAYRG